MTSINEAMLIAWVDGELDEVTRRRVDRALAEDPALAQRLEMHRALRDRLSNHYAPVASEPVPSAMQGLLKERAKITPLARPAGSRWRHWSTGGAIAASLLLGVVVGQWTRETGGPVAVHNGTIVARGELASALDAQLAAAQEGAAVRIGLSFRRKDGGGWCRSFNGVGIAGVACRERSGWKVEQLLPSDGQRTVYRQAGSADPRIMATVEALMADAPADARQEAAARRNGWR